MTWSLSNLVPQLMDSTHIIEGPVMCSTAQHLKAWVLQPLCHLSINLHT